MPIELIGKAFKFKTVSSDDVFIGDPTDTDFHPKVTLNRWQNECFLKLLFDDNKIPKAEKSCKLEGGKVKWATSDFEFHFYPLGTSQQNELGGLEFEIVNTVVSGKVLYFFFCRYSSKDFYLFFFITWIYFA